jgi:hypothetical protein
MLWWSNLEILFAPLHRSSPFIGGLRCQAIQTEHGPYIAEITQKAVYSMCLWLDNYMKGKKECRRYIQIYCRNTFRSLLVAVGKLSA